jgi:hypothetical protein
VPDGLGSSEAPCDRLANELMPHCKNPITPYESGAAFRCIVGRGPRSL